MGRRTYESLPHGALPNRRNIVLSRQTTELPGCDCYPSLEEALAHCDTNEDVYIIGGASVYRQAMPFATHLCLTEIDDTPEQADAYFPAIGTEWTEVARENHPADERHAYPFSFVDYERA